jgi:hypothetical protein
VEHTRYNQRVKAERAGSRERLFDGVDDRLAGTVQRRVDQHWRVTTLNQ